MKFQFTKFGFTVLCLLLTTQSVANAERTSSKKSGGIPEKISFVDLVIGMEADMVFRPFMLDVNPRTKEVLNQTVTIRGYMSPAVLDAKKNKKFILLKNIDCKFGRGGQADHLVYVKFKDGVTAPYTKKRVEVTGKLILNPLIGPDQNTWSIYDLVGESFKVVR